MSLVENEQVKLLANALDRASTACFTVGIVTPIAGVLYGIGNFVRISSWWLACYFAGWLLLAAILHSLARRTLKGLRS